MPRCAKTSSLYVFPLPPIPQDMVLKLDFLVVGGGIAGLAVAYALCKAGHGVHVLEKYESLGIPAGGLRVPPNMSKILRRWVGDQELSKTAVQNVGIRWYDLDTGKNVGYTEWQLTVLHEAGGDFLNMKHEDVHRLLHSLAVSAGAKISFGTSVTSVSLNDSRPSVTLATGEVLTTDIIIGADGPASIVRQVVLGHKICMKPVGCTLLAGRVPASSLIEHPELKKWVTSDEWTIFMGNSRSILAYPMHSKKELAFSLHWPDEDAGVTAEQDEGSCTWEQTVSIRSVQLNGCDPETIDIVKQLVEMTPNLVRSRWREPVESIGEWSDESGRVILIGEAAHPWFPGGTYGPSMALEGAVVLGALFSHLNSFNQIPVFANAFQEIRESRVKAVKAVDVTNAKLCHLPPGSERDKRNENMSLLPEEWDDGALQRQYERIASIFSYESQDAADEWWINWGRFSELDDISKESNARPEIGIVTFKSVEAT